MTELKNSGSGNFIKTIIDEDLKNNLNNGKIITRFPPEPNGYLHIGHAKSICLNFGISREYENAVCNLRFDDTNPAKEDLEYTESIKEDIKWIGFDWDENLFNASDYFDQLFEFAVTLIKKGKAYVCNLTADEIREYRGTLTEAGKNSPYRDRSIDENLDLFFRMRDGEFEDGTHILRAKIDMGSPNMNMRDPAIYRIKKMDHHRTGSTWCIYPMYDFAHSLSDSIEHITHSLCSLEFQDHRPLYNWFVEHSDSPGEPRQYEFARLNLEYTVLSKRKLIQLVQENHVSGWDDPRLLTIKGLRRRGYTPEAIRSFMERIGVSKRDSYIDMSILEDCLRNDLNEHAQRALCVLDPLKVIIENYPENESEELEAMNHPGKPEMGTRPIPFSREIYIERSDFMEDPPKKFFRLGPGKEVRLRFAYFLKCEGFTKDEETGEITELRCTYDPSTKGGSAPDGRKVKGTIHWVSAKHAEKVEVRLYDRLFSVSKPDGDKSGKDFKEFINPDSLTINTNAFIEPGITNAAPGTTFQFERTGYFTLDTKDSLPGKAVFNRSVTLRDSWAKLRKAELAGK